MRVDGFADGGTHISHHNRAARVNVYITLRSMQNKTPLRMRVDGFADAGTRISHHNRAKTAIVYITLRSMQKTRTKRHCACVWMGLQMVEHIYHTTIVLLGSTCISRFVQCKNKDKTPLRMRVDGFADGGTRISHHNRALSCMSCLCRFSEKAIVYLSDIARTLLFTYSTFCIY